MYIQFSRTIGNMLLSSSHGNADALRSASLRANVFCSRAWEAAL